MGGHDSHAPKHGAADAAAHHHHHHGPHYTKSIIHYDVPEPGHPIGEFKAPDYRIYKVENAPELVKVRNTLTARGLKDPWLRNEVWRFDPQFGSLAPRKLLFRSASMGMKWGLIIATSVILLEKGYGKLFGSADAHGHGHGHH